MLIGFKKRFIEPIQIGTKVFTMRNKRKVQPKIGETLYMYSGLRTNNTVKIGDTEKLMSIQEVYISMRRHWVAGAMPKRWYVTALTVKVDGRALSAEQIQEFVRYDGFTDVPDFAAYWFESSEKAHKAKKNSVNWVRGKLQLYHWTDLRY